MDFLTDWLTNWLKELLIGGIMGNLEGLFDTVNTQVGEIAAQVGTTPAAWHAGVFSLIRQLSETVILPIAGMVLTFVATYELIQMLLEKNNMHSIKHERLEAAVLFAVQHQVHLAVSYSEIVTQINSAPIKKSQSYRLDDLIAAKERELTKITRYKQSLYQDWKDGEITQQEYRDMKADYERQTSDISAVLTRLNAERAELANGVDNEHPALVAFMKYQNIEALNREILVELVDYIKVYENGNISVKFKFADELRKIAEYIEINTTEDTTVAG